MNEVVKKWWNNLSLEEKIQLLVKNHLVSIPEIPKVLSDREIVKLYNAESVIFDKRFTKTPEDYLHFVWGENKVCHSDFEFIIHMVEPRCFIKFNVGLAMFADFEEFYQNIADVQWIDGRPSEKEVKDILTKAWNYLCIEEQLLEADLDNEDDF